MSRTSAGQPATASPNGTTSNGITTYPDGTMHSAPVQTDRTVTTDSNRHRVETQRGRRVHVNDTTDTRTVTDETFDAHVLRLVREEDKRRQKLEDTRANHRNLNRMLTLLAALVIGLAVTFILTHGYLGAWGPVLAPYAFVITVAMDSTLAAYSFIRHY